MLKKLDKIIPLLALAILGYLTYDGTSVNPVKSAQAKESPGITRQMLHPALTEPAAHASPVERDPFEVEWAGYLHRGVEKGTVPTQPAARKESVLASTAPSGAGPLAESRASPSSLPEMPVLAVEPPPLTVKVSGILVSDDFHAVVIDDHLYKSGDLIGGTDASKCWAVQTIEPDCVVVQFGGVCRTLQITAPEAKANTGPEANLDTRLDTRPPSAGKREYKR